jgi:hypothetical protein
MPTSSATNRKISWFKREEDAGTLDLTPEFQRRPVWTDEQSSYLIDTVLHGLPFPEVYLRSITTEEGETTHQVVDGQQRIRALLAFGRNRLELIGEDVAPTLVGKGFDDLTPEQKLAFWEYEVVTRDLSHASDVEIRSLFRRLNIAAVNLNDQELRHAKYKGEFLRVMESLADNEWWTDIRVVTIKQVRRMEDVEFISELFVGMMAGPQDKKKSLDQFYDEFENVFPDKERWVRVFNETIAVLGVLMNQEELQRWSGRSDFYSLFTVTSSYVAERKKWTPKRLTRVSARLHGFRRQVDQAKRRDNVRQFPANVHEYAEAVTRAASDIARRKARDEILRRIVDQARLAPTPR